MFSVPLSFLSFFTTAASQIFVLNQCHGFLVFETYLFRFDILVFEILS